MPVAIPLTTTTTRTNNSGSDNVIINTNNDILRQYGFSSREYIFSNRQQSTSIQQIEVNLFSDQECETTDEDGEDSSSDSEEDEDEDSFFSDSDSDSDGDNDSDSDNDSESGETETETEEDFDEGQSLLNPNSQTGDLFEEYFDFDPSLIYTTSRTCDHTISSPCHFCAPHVSMRLANEVRIAFKTIFAKFNIRNLKICHYVPLDPSITKGTFKALKALHDLDYIKCILDEIIHLIVTVQNLPKFEIGYGLSAAILRIHDRIESLLDDIRGSEKYDEYQMLLDFRNKLNSIGLIQANYEENYIATKHLIDYQR